jgi:hypothetical protein
MNSQAFVPAVPCASVESHLVDAWRARAAVRPLTTDMPSLNSIVPATGVAVVASAALRTAGRFGYGAAKQAAPPRGRLR